MKPVVSAGAKKAAIVLIGGTLVALGEALQSGASFSDPATWIRILKAVATPEMWLRLAEGAGFALLGKELWVGATHIKLSHLPLEWVKARDSQA